MKILLASHVTVCEHRDAERPLEGGGGGEVGGAGAAAGGGAAWARVHGEEGAAACLGEWKERVRVRG